MTGSAQSMSDNFLVCCICAGPVPLETSKTDECGKAVHEECYVRKITGRIGEPSAALEDSWLSAMLMELQLRIRVGANS